MVIKHVLHKVTTLYIGMCIPHIGLQSRINVFS